MNIEKVAVFCHIASDFPLSDGRKPLIAAMSDSSAEIQRRIELHRRLGERIKDAADRIGGLQKLAPLLSDVSRRTLSDYVSGKSEPKAGTLLEIVEATGVTIQWLVSGIGPVSVADLIREKRPVIDEALLLEVKNMVAEENAAAGIHLTADNTMRTAIENYNAMVLHAENPGDDEEMKSLLPWVRRRIKRGIAAAQAQPGTGKRLA